MGKIKDRNSKTLTDAEEIKKRWQEYTELYKKDPHNPDNQDGVITDLEPDILECEFKWALDRDLIFLSREGRDLGVAFQAPPGSQASSRGPEDGPQDLGALVSLTQFSC